MVTAYFLLKYVFGNRHLRNNGTKYVKGPDGTCTWDKKYAIRKVLNKLYNGKLNRGG